MGSKAYQSKRRENPPGYDAARLVSRLAEDEQRSHWRTLWEQIRTALCFYYLIVAGGILSSIWDDEAGQFMWYMLGTDAFWAHAATFLMWATVIALIAAIAYFIGGALHHQSHAADHRASRQFKPRTRPLTPAEALEIKRTRDVAKGRMMERSRNERRLFRQMYEPTKEAGSDTQAS